MTPIQRLDSVARLWRSWSEASTLSGESWEGRTGA